MNEIAFILTLIAALAAGTLLGLIPAVRAFGKGRAFVTVRNAVLYSLIFAMGFKLGGTKEIAENLPTLGAAAAAFALATVAGTALVLVLFFSLRPGPASWSGKPAERRAPAAGGKAARTLAALRDPALLLLILAAGFALARLLPVSLDVEPVITAVLYALLCAIGIGLSGSGLRFREVIRHPDLILIPLGTAVGSLLGGLAAGLLLGMRPGTSLAVASGFGWYSLSGVMLTQLDGPVTGSIAFLANVLRESAALLLIPAFARTRFPYIAIGAGGATAMDVTLPLIEKNCGSGSVAFAIASGAILSLLVPVLVPLFAGMH